MADARWERLTAASGMLFILVLLVSTFMLPRAPSASAPGTEIAAYFSDHHSAGLVAGYLSGIGAILALWFFSVLASVLRRAEGDTGHLWVLALVAGVSTVVVVLGVTAVRTSLYVRTAQEGDPGVVRALYDMSSSALHFASFLLAIFLAAAAMVILRTGALPRWLGWIGLVFAALQLAAAAGVLSDTGGVGNLSLLALLTFALWTVLASAVLTFPRPAQVLTAPTRLGA